MTPPTGRHEEAVLLLERSRVEKFLTTLRCRLDDRIVDGAQRGDQLRSETYIKIAPVRILTLLWLVQSVLGKKHVVLVLTELKTKASTPVKSSRNSAHFCDRLTAVLFRRLSKAKRRCIKEKSVHLCLSLFVRLRNWGVA